MQTHLIYHPSFFLFFSENFYKEMLSRFSLAHAKEHNAESFRRQINYWEMGSALIVRKGLIEEILSNAVPELQLFNQFL